MDCRCVVRNPNCSFRCLGCWPGTGASMRILFRALIRGKKIKADATTHLLFSFEFDKFICRFQALYETLLTMHILGFIAAALIGVSLGLIGGGGSILTVPVLVYLFSVQP